MENNTTFGFVVDSFDRMIPVSHLSGKDPELMTVYGGGVNEPVEFIRCNAAVTSKEFQHARIVAIKAARVRSGAWRRFVNLSVRRSNRRLGLSY